jgi:hypothetical protein
MKSSLIYSCPQHKSYPCLSLDALQSVCFDTPLLAPPVTVHGHCLCCDLVPPFHSKSEVEDENGKALWCKLGLAPVLASQAFCSFSTLP